jgi:hypothetical protein
MNLLRKTVLGSRLTVLALLLLTLVGVFVLMTPKSAEAIVSCPGGYVGLDTSCYDANHQLICESSCGDPCDCTGAVTYRHFQACCYF